MDSFIDGNEIISSLRAEKVFLSENFGVVDIGLFGSFAKGKSSMDSDIDFIVELKEPKFDWIAGLQVYLENKFNRKIEIVRKGKGINSRFTKRVEKEIIYV
jgi:uncharacterized protein